MVSSILRVSVACLLLPCSLLTGTGFAEEMKWVTYEGGDGAGQGKQIVLLAGDEEYRSEETMPMLGQILSQHHGFKSTVLFASDPDEGYIDPNNSDNIPGMSAIQTADLIIMSWRFRNPTDGMEYFDAHIRAGKPIIGLRTSTHAFNGFHGKYAKYNNGHEGPEWKGGFGREILGEKWISHHGHHGHEATRGVLTPAGKKHVILTGVDANTIWGPSDVYGVRLPLPGNSEPLVLGKVLDGMEVDSAPTGGKQNDPMMPVCWTKTYWGEKGEVGRVFTTTMGASQDFVEPGLRRVVVNAAFWALDMADAIRPDLRIDFVTEFEPTPFGFHRESGYWKEKGLHPSDFALEPARR